MPTRRRASSRRRSTTGDTGNDDAKKSKKKSASSSPSSSAAGRQRRLGAAVELMQFPATGGADGADNNTTPPGTEIGTRGALAYYYSRCDLHRVKPDPAVAIALQTGSRHVLAQAHSFDLANLLPLCEVLAAWPNTSVQRLSFKNCSLGPMSCACLAACLRENTSVKTLELWGNNIDDDAATALAEVLRNAPALHCLNMHANLITPVGAEILAGALADTGAQRATAKESKTANNHGGGLRQLIITNNYLCQSGVDMIAKAGAEAGVKVQVKDGNFWWEEVWNAITHGLGVAFAIASLVVMAHISSACHVGWRTWTGVLVYSIAQMLMFLCSTLYHSFYRFGGADAGACMYTFGVLDHAAIYLLIAGTYTPILLGPFYDDYFGIAAATLIVIWVLALLGIGLDVFGDSNSVVLKRLSLALYVVMGWLVMFISPWLFPLLTSKSLRLLAAGGVAYSGGVYFFIKGEEVASMHVIWHVCVLLGSTLHFFSVYDILFGPEGMHTCASVCAGGSV